MKHEAIPRETQLGCTAAELLQLAAQYGSAASLLKDKGPRGRAVKWAPYRLCTIHAIELYLSALLLHGGHSWREIVCDFRHDLAARALAGAAHGLRLQKRSTEMLVKWSSDGSYQATRYRPESLKDTLHPSLMWSVFQDVETTVRNLVGVPPIVRQHSASA